MKKYCFTSFSVSELKRVSESYGGFSFENVSRFAENSKAYFSVGDSWVDVIYVFSQLLRDRSEMWHILSGNIFVSQDGLFGIDENGNFSIIPPGSTVYLHRTGGLPKSFLAFLVKSAKLRWDIRVVTNLENPENTPLSSKCHALAYADGENFPRCVVPYVCDEGDFSYLVKFIRESGRFGESAIAKNAGFSSGEGIRIFGVAETGFEDGLRSFVSQACGGDYVIMELLDVSDTEYRVYWAKMAGWSPKLLEVHGKERQEWQVLHNIAKWNTLRRLDLSVIPEDVQLKILRYCQIVPEFHGGLDILVGKDGKYYFTENNIMTGYLCEPEERYFAKEWLDSVASCYAQ